MTAAGGLLQAVLNGFAGIEITDKGIVLVDSVLPSSWKRLTVTGVGPERKTVEVVAGNTGKEKQRRTSVL